jgi:hypothetical protein
MKRQIPILLAIGASLYPVIAFFVPTRGVTRFNQTLDEWMVIIASFALLLGIVSMIQVNLAKVHRRSSGWLYGLIVLVTFAIMATFGLFGRQGARPEGGLYPFTWVFQFAFSPLQSTMFSVLAFYVASASYRAFRVRNVEATLLLIGALIIMIGRIPLGQSIHPIVPQIAEWIMKVPNTAAQRGVIIGAALGAAAMSIRVMVGIERPYLGKS